MLLLLPSWTERLSAGLPFGVFVVLLTAVSVSISGKFSGDILWDVFGGRVYLCLLLINPKEVDIDRKSFYLSNFFM